MLASHGFIAKNILDALIRKDVLSVSKVESFQRTVPAVASELIDE